MVASSRCPSIVHTDLTNGDGYLYVHAIPAPHVHCSKHGNSYGYEHCDAHAHPDSGHLPLPKTKP